jgi:hypothetical protein
VVNRIKLTHLTFVGENRTTATVGFGDGLTVVHGPSDTGKSFILDAISYMLGGEKLKQIAQIKGYRYVLLGLIVDGELLTLRRGLTGGSVSVFFGHSPDIWAALPHESMGWKHGRNAKNISTYLLRAIGLDGRRIRKNLHNATVDLSFRYVIHLCVIGEEKIQSARSPVVHNVMLKTADKSAFRVMLEGLDDAQLVEVESGEAVNAATKLRQAVVDDVIAETQTELSKYNAPDNSVHVLARLNDSLQDSSARVDQLVGVRDTLSAKRLSMKRQLSQLSVNLSETSALSARFQLLLEQYDSDLRRLELLHEADAVLSYFGATSCALCGAEPQHQLHIQSESSDAIDYGQSVVAEEQKTLRLRFDLAKTMVGIEMQSVEMRERWTRLETELQRVSSELVQTDQMLRPAKERIRGDLALRASIEKALVLQGQLRSLGSRRAMYADEGIVEVADSPAELDSIAVSALSKLIANRLESWGVPNATTAMFSATIQDVMIEGQEREAHGKGVRSLLHAAFTLSFAEFCFQMDLPHPGFIVLDSPLVAYRAPDKKNPNGPTASEEGLSNDVVEAFYKDIERNFDGQVIVLENTSPGDYLGPNSVNVRFSKSDDERYGLFPRDDASGS